MHPSFQIFWELSVGVDQKKICSFVSTKNSGPDLLQSSWKGSSGGICSHPATRALVKSGTNVGLLDLACKWPIKLLLKLVDGQGSGEAGQVLPICFQHLIWSDLAFILRQESGHRLGSWVLYAVVPRGPVRTMKTFPRPLLLCHRTV